MAAAPAPTTESEAGLAAALEVLARLPGARLRRGADASWLASGRAVSSLNHVFGLDLGGNGGGDVERRIDEIDAGLRGAGSVPATWWIGPSSRPSDLAGRLLARGFQAAEPEFGMVIDVAAVGAGESAAFGDVGATGVEAAEVVDRAGLDAWLGVMAGSYGWSERAMTDTWGELYEGGLGGGAPWRSYLVRRDGVAVACSSIFVLGDAAFVTNVGTIPAARGGGLGTVATVAALRGAADLGRRRASLTASVMGRGLYARLGFVEECRLDRYVSAG